MVIKGNYYFDHKPYIVYNPINNKVKCNMPRNETEIVIKYPKGTSKRLWNRIVYEDELPTKADIATDYKELPISNSFWLNKFDKINSSKLPIKEHACFLAVIFSIMNTQDNPMSTKEMQNWIKENKVSHTSMSVGDVIELNNKTYVCATVGWKEIA